MAGTDSVQSLFRLGVDVGANDSADKDYMVTGQYLELELLTS